MILTGRHYATGEPVNVSIDAGRISDIRSAPTRNAADLPFISPGLLDIQVNGFDGIWFSRHDLTIEHVVHVCESLVARGVSRFLPTLITASQTTLEHAFKVLEAAADRNSLVQDCVVGYHLEGPYISREDGPRGAHPLEHVRPADVAEFEQLQESAGGNIRLLTLAADCPDAVTLIQHCQKQGIKVALGHTAGTSDEIAAAVNAGAELSTHFGNGAHGELPRHPNYLWDQLAEDRLWASVIADGVHIPNSVLKCVFKCKTLERTILTCDASGFAGCQPGTYREENMNVEVLPDGRLVVAGQRQFLAGSGVTTGECVAHVISECGITLPEAIQMASTNPGRFLGLNDTELKTGNPATLCAFRLDKMQGRRKTVFQPVATYTNGRLLND